MKAVCPNDPSHDRFITSAYVGEDWKVDASGTFVESLGHNGDILHWPDPDNIWTCAVCGAGAKVTY